MSTRLRCTSALPHSCARGSLERWLVCAVSSAAAGACLQGCFAAPPTPPPRYYENRVRAVQAAKARGENPYPHKFDVSIQLPAYVAKYADLEAGTQVRLVGAVRRNGPWGGGRLGAESSGGAPAGGTAAAGAARLFRTLCASLGVQAWLPTLHRLAPSWRGGGLASGLGCPRPFAHLDCIPRAHLPAFL